MKKQENFIFDRRRQHVVPQVIAAGAKWVMALPDNMAASLYGTPDIG
ncbi:hypothetical protein [Pantoea sp. VS1]|nr:hypothetical protein [Pantoea sp. VS1]